MKELKSIIDRLKENRLGLTISALRQFIASHPHLMSDDALDRIDNDYQLMLNFLQQGVNDPQRDEIYSKLTERLYHLCRSLQLSLLTKENAFFAHAYRCCKNESFSYERVKSTLENFVAEVAMLSLEPEEQREEKSKKIHLSHNDFRKKLFCSIVTSGLWTESDAKAYAQLIISPTIDSIDAQLMVSAIMVAATNYQDFHKFVTLLSVYQKAQDEHVRQKALIGWIFIITSTIAIDHRVQIMLIDVLKDDHVVQDLSDLQKQIMFCKKAEEDKDTIQRDIIPEIMKNNHLEISRSGIKEKEYDPMEDIFDPDAADRRMEKLEESFKKMVGMQKAGSDIYFGGFSQMKRFRFFNHHANWFMPFYIENPDIAEAVNNMKEIPLVKHLISKAPFCDSDKYSFALAMSDIVNKLPAQMRNMMGYDESMFNGINEEEMESPAYIRRMALQDLYRFYQLHNDKACMVNPFDDTRALFVTNVTFLYTNLKKIYNDLCLFMHQQNKTKELETILLNHIDMSDVKCMMMHATLAMKIQDPWKALPYLQRAILLEPDNRKVLKMLGKVYFAMDEYEDAAEYFEKLHNLDPDNEQATLFYAIALAKAEDYDKALPLLYKLSFDNENDMAVCRALAWTLMAQGKLKQAENEYRKLLESDDTETGDLLNAGYCQLLSGNIHEAIILFKSFAETTYEKTNPQEKKVEAIIKILEDKLEDDMLFLEPRGINDNMMFLIVDLVYRMYN